MQVITPAYAAVFALVFVALSFRTIGLRRRFQVGIGPGDNDELARAMRVHANFAEYVPLALVLIYFLEIYAGSTRWVHVLCAGLLIGRILHAYGVSQVKEKLIFRQVGMVLTFLTIISASLRIIYSYF